MEVDSKPVKTIQNPRDVIEKVVVHPLVLLSVVDHFNRMSKVGNQKRVVGVLLGSIRNKILDVANSFACKYTSINQFYKRIQFVAPGTLVITIVCSYFNCL